MKPEQNIPLFEIEPQTRDVNFNFHTYKGNRIVGKIMSTLKENETFGVRVSSDSYEEYKIYQVSINSSAPAWAIKAELLEEIELMIPELFPVNYQFNFTEDSLGFVSSFKAYSNEGKFIDCSHRIKEIKTDGRSNVPQKQIIKNK